MGWNVFRREEMPAYSIGEEFLGSVPRESAAVKTREDVSRLFEEARDDVYRYLLTLGLYPPRAQEATQEVFLRLYATLRSGESVRNPRAWIFRVAHNLGLNIRARQDSELPFDADWETRYVSSSADPEKETADRERMARFHRQVENLSEQQRRCLLLRLEGLRYPEIASILGISASAVGEFLRRAIERLRKSP
jgi:RNA polymerase sigma-70 factor (ECF subfamily)